jgi:hypothetical protein
VRLFKAVEKSEADAELRWLVNYPSGQRGQIVNLLAFAFAGSNPAFTIYDHL